MKKIDRKYFIIFGILLLLISVIRNSSLLGNNNKKNSINDYYDYINKKELKKIKLKDDEVAFTRFNEYQEKVDDEIKKISSNLKNNNDNAERLYNLYLSDERDNLGIYPLKNYLDRIDNCSEINSFTRVVSDVEKELYMDIFMSMSVSPDMKDNSKNIVYLDSVKFDFDVVPYFFDDSNYSSYAAYLKQGQLRFLKLYGYDNNTARELSTRLYNMEKDVASKSKSYADSVDYTKMYNRITKDELKNLYSNLDVEYYLNNKGVGDQEYYSIIDKDNYIAFNEYLTNDNLDLLKEFVKLRILEHYSNYLSDDYVKVVFDINNKMSGISKEFSREELADTLVKNVYSDVIEKKYSDMNKSEEKEKYLNELFSDVIKFYKSEINDIDWMSSKTKKLALKKLDTMKINVSSNDIVLNSDSYYISNNSLFDNILNIERISYERELVKLKDNSKESQYSETLVNAFYNPQDNSINFPTAYLGMIDVEKDYYENLGIVGMVVGHEVTHAIDSNGAKFDYNGNLTDWWTKEDYKKFEKLTSRVVEYYSKYKISGINVNGEVTLGENIADLGAIRCITGIAKSKGATDEDLKKMYKGFAQNFIIKINPTYEKLLMASDVHSPNKVRVNATLSSTDEFYDVYKINKNDGMYISKKERVKVW